MNAAKVKQVNRRKSNRFDKFGLSHTCNLRKKIDDTEWSNYKLVLGGQQRNESQSIRRDCAPDIPAAYMAYEIIFIPDGLEKSKAIPHKIDKRTAKRGVKLYRNKAEAFKKCSSINIAARIKYKLELKAINKSLTCL